MKKTLTRQQVFELWYVLKDESLDKEKLDKRFDYVRSRNLEILSPEVNQILKAREPTNPKYLEYEKAQKEIFEKYGEPQDTKYVIKDENKDIALVELENLKEEYKDVILERKVEVDAYNELIYEEIEVDVAIVSFKYFPSVVNAGVMRILKMIIKETPEELEELILQD